MINHDIRPILHSQDSRDHQEEQYDLLTDFEAGTSNTLVVRRNHQDTSSATSTQSSLTDFMVEAASLCNRVIVERCGLCTTYCDQQIQYEFTSTTTTTPTSAMMMTAAAVNNATNTTTAGIANLYEEYNYLCASSQVQAARNVLFDEESVVHSVSSR